VVNDSGQPLPGAGWQHSDHVRMINTNRRERSIVRNAPCALQHFWALSQSSRAKWLYGVTQFLDRMHNATIRLQHGLNGNCFIQFMAGEWIPLHSSLIDAQTLFEINGFNPLLSGPEDIDLLRRFGLVSEVAGTPYLVAHVVRGEAGSTTDYGKHQQASRWAREKILDSPLVYRAMRSSARTLSWRGRMARIYLTSCLWNIRRMQLFTAANRLLYGLRSILAAGTGLISPGTTGGPGFGSGPGSNFRFCYCSGFWSSPSKRFGGSFSRGLRIALTFQKGDYFRRKRAPLSRVEVTQMQRSNAHTNDLHPLYYPEDE